MKVSPSSPLGNAAEGRSRPDEADCPSDCFCFLVSIVLPVSFCYISNKFERTQNRENEHHRLIRNQETWAQPWQRLLLPRSVGNSRAVAHYEPLPHTHCTSSAGRSL